MQRREFMKSSLVSLVSLGVMRKWAFGANATRGAYAEGRKITLSNRFLEWQMEMSGGSAKSTSLHNLLSGRTFALSSNNEVQLTFSDAKTRVEIPWWHTRAVSAVAGGSPESEQGYQQGFHSPSYREDAGWGTSLNLLRAISGPVYSGYCWFRQEFELPVEASSDEITLCLGGYTQEDWNEYWIFVNGVPAGYWTRSGRWREPEEAVIKRGSPAHTALKFGGGQKNLLAIRTYQLDRHFEGATEDILDRFVFDERLSDQFIAVGQPYRRISNFRMLRWRKEENADQAKCEFDFENREEQLQLTLHFELDGFARRKWFEVKNTGARDRLLLDVDLDDFHLDAPTTEGDYGQPLLAGGELFCAVEHPAGVNQGMSGRVRLRHFPGKKLAAGGVLTSQASLIGVAPANQAREQFLNFIRAHSPRKNLLSIYDPLGINGFPDSPCWTLDDREMLGTMQLLQKWQQKGIKFDYYVPDVGWQDRTGDMTQYWPQCFPNGPEQVIERANQLGMKWGLWFSGTYGDWSIGDNPRTAPSRVPDSGTAWPRDQHRDGFPQDNWEHQLCLASEPYFTMFRDGLIEHIRRLHLRLYKVDTSEYYCNSTEHNHLPGKYSTEANFDALIEIAKATREANPDLYIMWYWGIRSPFFLYYGDSIFEKRITLEAASTGDYPALFFRDGVTLALDQGTQFSEFIPPMCKDSLGVWITDTYWGNAMRKERWREAAVMDLGRGSLLFPQLWGDLYSFEDDDVEFLSRIQRLAKDNEAILCHQKAILGDPWKNEVYGYAHFEKDHGLIFMNNLDFQARSVRLAFGEDMGLKAPAGTRLRLIEHFPNHGELTLEEGTLSSGQTLEAWLRPFEVALWEVLPETQEVEGSGELSKRTLLKQNSNAQSQQLELAEDSGTPAMEVYFAEPDPHFRSSKNRPALEDFKKRGYEKRSIARRTVLPQFQGRQVLAVVLRFRKDGKVWRTSQPADLIQAAAKIGEQSLQMEAVPSFRQTENNQWAPWLVFKIRSNEKWAGSNFRIAITAYLPPEVDCQEEGWLVPEWWT